MTTARAIPVGGDRHIVVVIRLVFVCVAARAIRFIGGVGINHRLAVAHMASGTGKLAGMVARITSRTVPEGKLSPQCRGVAGVALQRGHEMCGGLAGGGHPVMTGGTGTGHGIVIEIGGLPGHCAVACPAIR